MPLEMISTTQWVLTDIFKKSKLNRFGFFGILLFLWHLCLK